MSKIEWTEKTLTHQTSEDVSRDEASVSHSRGGGSMKPLDIQGGHPIVVVTSTADQHAQIAATGAMWCALNCNAAWCLAPDPFGELEFSFVLKKDLEEFKARVLSDLPTATIN